MAAAPDDEMLSAAVVVCATMLEYIVSARSTSPGRKHA
jgi:hypothetical protein